MNPYCDTCFVLFKFLQSCPRSSVFAEGTDGEKFLEILWVLGSLFPFIIYLGLLLFIIFGRTSRVLFLMTSFGFMQVINDILLKRNLAEARPTGSCSDSYGLPSGHAAFAACWLTWLVLEWVMFHDKVPFKRSRFHVAIRTIGILVVPIVPISRYYLQYHSVKQICYGLLVGFIWALVYFWVTLTLLHRNEGKFWSIRVTAILKKVKFTDNMMSYEIVETTTLLVLSKADKEQQVDQESSEEEIKSEDIEAQAKEEKKLPKLILPLREGIRRFIWRSNLNETVQA